MLEIGSKVITKLDDKTTGWSDYSVRTRRDNAIGTITGTADSRNLIYQVHHEDNIHSWYEAQELIMYEDIIKTITDLSNVNNYGGRQYIYTLISTDGKTGEVRYGINWGKEVSTIEFFSLESCINILKEIRSKMIA